MPIFGRKPTLAEAVDKIRAEMQAGTLPGEVLGELRRREQPVVSGGREPPGLQEMLEAVPGAAALLEVGGRMVARNAAMMRLLGRASTVLETTRSAELQDVCARGLAGWPQRRELTLPALDLMVEAHVTPLSHARALLVLRDLTAERRADRVRRDFIANASHELRTPVTAIRGAAETLLDGGLDLPEQAREFVRVISRHAARGRPRSGGDAVGRGYRSRHRAAAPGAHLRALLPRGCRPLARAWRNRARARHRQASRAGDERGGGTGKLAKWLAILGAAAQRLTAARPRRLSLASKGV